MKRNLKLLTLIVALMLCLSMVFTGCKNTDDTGKSDASKSGSTATSTSAGDSTDTSSSAPADDPSGPTLDFTANTVLRMATGYNSAETGIAYSAKNITEGDKKDSNPNDGILQLSNGKTYNSGDLKPTWQELEKRLNVKFESKYQGNSASAEFTAWENQLADVDMVSGTASGLQVAGQEGKVVDISKYLYKMPNFKAYLDANPIVRLSITGSAEGSNAGAIYFSPYFDGVDDIERMPLMRADWIVKLLDGDTAFASSASKNLAAAVYEPYMPTSGKVAVEVVDGDAKKTIEKDYDKAGNIVKKMNDAGAISGVEAVAMLRKYIDDAYNGYYGNTRSNLFVGENAAWDADELVALLRCVVANPQELTGTDTIYGMFSRQEGNNQRRVDLFRFAGTLFGVRGLESRQDYLYFDKEGNLHDARQEKASYEAMIRMNALRQEGLISSEFNKTGATLESKNYLRDNNGFMSYDYNQTQTLLNDTELNLTEQRGEYIAAMVPVARWNDGDGERFMRFTESWRSVKTDGWAISAAGVGGNKDKLNAALKLIDYAYSKEGQVIMSYGPDEFIKVKDANGTTVETKYETFDFNGAQWPVINDACQKDLKALANGNYTNFARQYLGSTLSFAKSQAFEYQCTVEIGKKGAANISKAIALGTIKHPKLAVESNMWYTSIPTVLPTTAEENAIINEFAMLASSGPFSQSKNKTNIFVSIISSGIAGSGYNSVDEAIDAVTSLDGGGNVYLGLKQEAWGRLQKFYKENISK